LEEVQSGSVTYAVRDTKIDGIEIKKDEFMGLAEDKIVTSDADQLTAVKGLLDKLLTDDSEILTMISGEESNQDVTEQLSEWIEETYP
ncbi:hypothetical protein WL232_12775, partial [Staphylococcus epidermidis]